MWTLKMCEHVAAAVAPTYASVSFNRVSMHANAGCIYMDKADTIHPGAHSVIRGDEANAFVQLTVRFQSRTVFINC